MKPKPKTTPTLRFPGFAGGWGERRLGELCSTFRSGSGITSENISEAGKFPVFGGNGLRGYTDTFTHDGVFFLIGRQGALCGNINLVKGKTFISEHAIAVAGNELTDTAWLAFRLHHHNLNRLSESSAQPGLSVGKLTRLKFHIPTLPEQRKIAAFLTAVDGRLEQLRQKQALLADYKRGVMQQLFTQALRFKDDHDHAFPSWAETTLGAIASFSKGCGIAKADVHEDGALPCIRYGELYTHYSELIGDVKSRTNVPETDLVLSQRNDVIIPASGETHIDIATAACVTVDGVALGGDLNIIRTKQNGVFLAYYLNNACKHAIAGMAQGSSVIHLYPDQLKRLRLHLPSVPEQTKIAAFLSALDRKIENVAAQLDHTRAFKQGLLQQLFV
jgi:type I restriction enzyme S subunit